MNEKRETFVLRNGSELRIVPLDTEGLRMTFEVMASGDNDQALEVVKRILPDASAADIICLAAFPDDVAELLKRAGRFNTPRSTFALPPSNTNPSRRHKGWH